MTSSHTRQQTYCHKCTAHGSLVITRDADIAAAAVQSRCQELLSQFPLSKSPLTWRRGAAEVAQGSSMVWSQSEHIMGRGHTWVWPRLLLCNPSVLFHTSASEGTLQMTTTTPWAGGSEMGGVSLFESRNYAIKTGVHIPESLQLFLHMQVPWGYS